MSVRERGGGRERGRERENVYVSRWNHVCLHTEPCVHQSTIVSNRMAATYMYIVYIDHLIQCYQWHKVKMGETKGKEPGEENGCGDTLVTKARRGKIGQKVFHLPKMC